MPSPQQAGLAGHHARGQHPGGRADAVKLDRTEVGAAVAVLCVRSPNNVCFVRHDRRQTRACTRCRQSRSNGLFGSWNQTREEAHFRVRLGQAVTLQPTAGLWLHQ